MEYDASLATRGPSVAGAVYSTGTNGKSHVAYHDPCCQLFVTDSGGVGLVTILDGASNVLFSTGGFQNPVADTLYPGTALHQTQRLYSQNGLYWLTVQVRPLSWPISGALACA